MFARIKTIKGNPYLYLVENTWVKGKVRQKVKKYIGRVQEPSKVLDLDFFEFFKIDNPNNYVKSKSREDVIKDISAFNLANYGFTESNKNKWKFSNVTVDLNNLSVKIKKRDTAIKLNDGFFYNEIIKDIIEFKPGRDKEKSGMELAELFVCAGLNIPQEIFVYLIMGKNFNLNELI